MSVNSIPQLSDDKLLDDTNYSSWKDTVHSLIRGKGLIGLQTMKTILEVTGVLLAYWDAVWKKEVEKEGANVTNALTTSTSNVPNSAGGGALKKCTNCGKRRHGAASCYALNGGREGQGPDWYIPPVGKEPRQSFIDAFKAKGSAPTAASTSTPSGVTSPPIVATTSPISTYALFANEADGGGTPSTASRTVADVLHSRRRSQESPAVLMKHFPQLYSQRISL
ncbi:hypothetical protein GGX14DRAFT_393343 [Mycena pura]|uniref:Retrotransposon Copia-like N-terminal domain-containing protein n=1 Tax=Mycena pura TaxID=153505 RepID=A0AAD6VL43_9AGAR|nr:hypothetical protein GGX14DRAFT_393343 [Mycena pura]